MDIRQLWRGALIAGGLAALAACSTAGFDPAGYQSAVQLKYETMSLLDNSSAPYRVHQAAANSLQAKYTAAAENAGKNAGNESIAQQWAAIRDPRGASAGGVIEQWKKAPLRPGQRAEKKRAIAAHFDRLICLEGSRQAHAECGDTGAMAEAGPAPAPAAAAAAPAPRAAARRTAPKPAADAPEEVEYETEPQKE